MRKAQVLQKGVLAGILEERGGESYRFSYRKDYVGDPISLTMPVREAPYEFNQFPPILEGLLPEGPLLEAMLRRYKLDRNDLFRQVFLIGEDTTGSLTIRAA